MTFTLHPNSTDAQDVVSQSVIYALVKERKYFFRKLSYFSFYRTYIFLTVKRQLLYLTLLLNKQLII